LTLPLVELVDRCRSGGREGLAGETDESEGDNFDELHDVFFVFVDVLVFKVRLDVVALIIIIVCCFVFTFKLLLI
jgi:hypothetical protein